MNIAFNPQVVTITAGSTVTWTNFDPFAHTTTSDDLGLWDSGILAPGLVFTHTFNTPGIFLYHCNIHSTMHGTVVVVNSASQPPTQVTIDGPTGGAFDTPYTFTATVHPLTATQPITYFWQATGQSSATHVGGGISDTIAFSWTAGITRVQWITVTASNASSSAGGTHLLIIDPIIVYLPLIFK